MRYEDEADVALLTRLLQRMGTEGNIQILLISALSPHRGSNPSRRDRSL
jgi:hypothetical protein